MHSVPPVGCLTTWSHLDLPERFTIHSWAAPCKHQTSNELRWTVCLPLHPHHEESWGRFTRCLCKPRYRNVYLVITTGILQNPLSLKIPENQDYISTAYRSSLGGFQQQYKHHPITFNDECRCCRTNNWLNSFCSVKDVFLSRWFISRVNIQFRCKITLFYEPVGLVNTFALGFDDQCILMGQTFWFDWSVWHIPTRILCNNQS